MKKRIIKITIFVMLLFAFCNVKAIDAPYTIVGVNDNLAKYKAADEELNNNKCDGQLTTQLLVDKCNTLSLQKSRALTYLYNAKAYDKDLVSDEALDIMAANSENCKSAISSEIQDVLNRIFLMFYIAGPILLIIFGSLDLTKAIVAGDEKKRKALYTKFIKRCIALALLFVSPVLVGLLVNMFGTYKYAKSAYTCSYTRKELSIIYTPVVKYNKTNSINGYGNQDAASRIVASAENIESVANQAKWRYKCQGGWSNLKNAYNNKTYIRLCCAEFVSLVLYDAGIFSDSDITGMESFNRNNCGDFRGWTYATGIQSFLMKKGWIKITDKSQLQPGDIVFSNPQYDKMPTGNCYPEKKRAGHVSIYMPDGKKLGAHGKGDTDPINPYRNGVGNIICAYRAP